jgi:hypothetical protein
MGGPCSKHGRGFIYEIIIEIPEGKDNKFILKSSVGGFVLVSAGSGSRPVADCYEHGTRPSAFINGRKFFGYLSD